MVPDIFFVVVWYHTRIIILVFVIKLFLVSHESHNTQGIAMIMKATTQCHQVQLYATQTNGKEHQDTD